jgi:hypothetical protein
VLIGIKGRFQNGATIAFQNHEVVMGKMGGVLIATALTLMSFITLAQGEHHMMGEEDHVMDQGDMMKDHNRGMMNEGEMMHEGGDNNGMMRGEGHDEGMMDNESGAEDQSDDE